jgi:TRAP-type C4-dicarboxylate transport system permease large subunit
MRRTSNDRACHFSDRLLDAFLIAGMSRTVSIQGVFLATSPFLAVMGVLLALLMLFPDLALFIPRTMK